MTGRRLQFATGRAPVPTGPDHEPWLSLKSQFVDLKINQNYSFWRRCNYRRWRDSTSISPMTDSIILTDEDGNEISAVLRFVLAELDSMGR